MKLYVWLHQKSYDTCLACVLAKNEDRARELAIRDLGHKHPALDNFPAQYDLTEEVAYAVAHSG